MRDENSCTPPWWNWWPGQRADQVLDVQNWYPGDEMPGRIYNFVTKRGECRAQFQNSGLRWRPGRPSPGNTELHLKGDNSIGEFYSSRRE